MNSFCSFCASTGIKGPHDHFVKSSKSLGAKVVCPKLLATVCNFCNKTGHIDKYCGEKREYNTMMREELKLAKRIQIDSGDWVESLTSLEYENGTWSIFNFMESALYDGFEVKRKVNKDIPTLDLNDTMLKDQNALVNEFMNLINN